MACRMRVPASSTETGRRGAFLTFALALGLALLCGRPGLSLAEEARVRGDLPPIASSPEGLNLNELSVKEARALFREVHKLLSERMGGDRTSTRDLYLGAIQGMLDQVNAEQAAAVSGNSLALPAPGMLLSGEQAARLRDALDGQVTGIGIEFQLHAAQGIIVVSRVLPGSAAESAGMLAGDQILAIDGERFSGSSLEQVLSMLQGSQDSPVAFEFVRAGTKGSGRYMMTLTRSTFSVESTASSLEGPNIGYLRVHQIHRGTPDEVEQRLGELLGAGAEHFVLDLRDCVGGDLEAARALVDLFVPEATMIAHVDEPGLGMEDLVAERPAVFEQSIAVLVNGWTRGSSELVAAALQEQNRAFLIGEPTLGRGSSETLIDLGHDLVLRLESVRISGPMGDSWAGKGVQPDQPIWAMSQGDSAGQGRDSDLQFQTAVHYLQSELTPPKKK